MNRFILGKFFVLIAITVGAGFIIYKKYSSAKKPVSSLPMLMLRLNCPYCKEGLEEYACADFQENGISQKVYKCMRCVEGEQNEIYYRSNGQAFRNENITLHRLQ